jgi:opacity protein-like surface antigen
MNKYIMTAAALVLATTAQASDHKSFNGFALGATAGYGMGSSTVITSGTGQAEPFTQKNNLSLKGMNGGLFMTYGWMLQKSFYLGLEAYGKLSSMEGTQDVNLAGGNKNSTIKAKNTNSFGAALRLGGVVNGMLAYVKVGVESANWKFEHTNDKETITLGGASELLSDSKSRRLTGIPVGVGMETHLNKNWILGGEFVYTSYGSTSTVETAAIRGADRGSIANKFRPKKSEFNLRIARKF